MNNTKPDFRILYLLAEEAREFCSKVAFVGDVNIKPDDISTIHLLCAVRNQVILENLWLKPVAAVPDDVIYMNRRKFKKFKREVEDFSYNHYIKQWHEKFPQVKIVIEEVNKHEFAFRELELNSSSDFYDELWSWYNVSDDETMSDGFVAHRNTGCSYGFDNERDLMEFFWGFSIPYHLRFPPFYRNRQEQEFQANDTSIESPQNE
jgi:hypothetical protein